MSEPFEFIVVGGGSSGCIVAGQLAEAGHRVLLLEAGERAEQNPETLVAAGYKDAFINDRLFIDRFSTRQAGLSGARHYLGSGRGMGGSGSVNGMVYTRGDRRDFQRWPEGWRWDDNVPAFAAVEARLRPRPLPGTPLSETCIAAAEGAGFRRSNDLGNGDLGDVLGYEPMNHEAGQRRNAYVAYIKEPQPPSLTVRTECRVAKVLVKDGRATGVHVFDERGEQVEIAASREVILCAGALESPRLLLLSGIGDPDELSRHGIPCVLPLPGVGRALQDHPNVVMFFVGKQPTDYTFPQLYGFGRANPATALEAGAPDTCYVFYTARSSFKEGVMKLLPAILLPLFLARLSVVRRVLQSIVRAVFSLPFLRRMVERMWGIVVILGKPKSRGRVRLASADPRAEALIDSAYFSDEEDRTTLRLAVRRALRIAGQAPLAAWGNRPKMAPSGSTRAGAPDADAPTDAAIDRYIRKNVMTTYHYSGTCKLGTGEDAVVDTALRVHGIANLRVADASIVPEVPVSAMNATSMMIGQRAANLVMAAWRTEVAKPATVAPSVGA